MGLSGGWLLALSAIDLQQRLRIQAKVLRVEFDEAPRIHRRDQLFKIVGLNRMDDHLLGLDGLGGLSDGAPLMFAGGFQDLSD